MNTFKKQYLMMFGGATEQEFYDDALSRPSTKLRISAAVCDHRLPRPAIGYAAALLARPSAAVAEDAIRAIRAHIPEFLAGIV